MAIKPRDIGTLTEKEIKLLDTLEAFVDAKLLDGHKREELKTKEGVLVVIMSDVEVPSIGKVEVHNKVIETLKLIYEKNGFKVKVVSYPQPAKYYLYFRAENL